MPLKAWCMELHLRPDIRMFRGETISLCWPEASAEQIKKTDTGFLPHIISFESSTLVISLGSYVDRNEEVRTQFVLQKLTEHLHAEWSSERGCQQKTSGSWEPWGVNSFKIQNQINTRYIAVKSPRGGGENSPGASTSYWLLQHPGRHSFPSLGKESPRLGRGCPFVCVYVCMFKLSSGTKVYYLFCLFLIFWQPTLANQRKPALRIIWIFLLITNNTSNQCWATAKDIMCAIKEL